MYVWCVWEFATRGHGTPAPIDPPKHLVITGLYRYVRNPMYTGLIVWLVGLSILYESWTMLAYAGAVCAIFNAAVFLYEEPTLRRQFGDAYVDYCKSTPRWAPNLWKRHETE